MSKAHIVVGATGTGKSYLMKQLLRKVKNKKTIVVYDVNREYSDFYPHKFNSDFEDFTDKVIKIEKGVFVFEEATIFLNNRSCNANLNHMLVTKRHTNNYIFLLFHSMRSVPRYIYELSNYITIFNTNDSPDMTARELKDDRIKDIMIRVKENQSNKKYYHKLPDGTNGNHYNETLKIY